MNNNENINDPERERSPWLLGILAAIAAALLVWFLGERGLLTIKPGIASFDTMMGVKAVGETSETRQAAEVRTSALTYATLGAVLALGLALTGGLSTGRVRSLATAVLVGVPSGAALGAIASFLTLPAYARWFLDLRGEPLPSLAMHCCLWLPLCGAAGLAYGLGRGWKGWASAVVVVCKGLVGGLLGTVFYDVLGTLAFPLAETTEPVSATPISRLAAFLSLSLFTTAGVLFTGRKRKRKGKTNGEP